MRSHQLKLAALSALQTNPDFSRLRAARSVRQRETRAFLGWLDQSGLALYLAWQLRECGAFGSLPPTIAAHLSAALELNRRRNQAMFLDFRRASESFNKRRVRHAFLKGFTLVPEFCPEPELRHQSDIDILVAPESEQEAKAAILDCGYPLERKLPSGEVHFSSELARVPSASDNIYRLDYQKEIELHTSVWEDTGRVSLPVPTDCLDRLTVGQLRGITFSSLSLEDAFIVQLLHAFRHLLSSWIRLSWLWEIHYFLGRHAENSSLWIAVRNRGGDDPFLRDAFGLILRLTNRLFASPIPGPLRHWCVETLPSGINCWVLEFGSRWALSEMPGSKLSLFVHKEFVRESRLWKSYLWRRLVPLAGNARLSKGHPSAAKALKGFAIKQRLFQAKRVAFHATSLMAFPVEAWRWKHASREGSSGPHR